MTQTSNGLFAPTRDWAALQYAYETHVGDLDQLAASNAISLKTLQAYARSRKWERRSEPAAQLSKAIQQTKARKPASRKLAKPKQKTRKKSVGSAAHPLTTPVMPIAADAIPITSITRAEIIGRLYAAIFRKVEQLEICMSTNEPVPTADHERETRIIGTLLRNVELVDDVTRPLQAASPTPMHPSLQAQRTIAGSTRSIYAASLRQELRDCANDSRADTLTAEVAADWPVEHLETTLADWQLWGRDDQLPPSLDGEGWRSWLVLGGRGAGKTRAGAEWVRAMALGHDYATDQPAQRIALVAETYHDVRSVMVEGISGLMSVHTSDDRPQFEPSKNQLTWPNGSIAQLFSGDDPDGLRGPQFDAAWCDELAKWRRGEATWDMLQFALRLGSRPRQLVTTTPRNCPLLTRIMADPMTITTRSATSANEANLAPSFVAEMQRRYAGTALGRQELDGEIITEIAGALWRQDWIDRMRIDVVPDLVRIVVALDPPVTSTQSSDACGIVIAGLGEDGRGYVLADRTIQGHEPHIWARATIAAYHDYKADRIVAEANQGGDMVVSVLRQVDATVPITKVHATRGKYLRAEPIAALYAEGRVAHVGMFKQLEEQMCSFGGGGFSGRSPDRLDALVWALTALMLEQRARLSVRML